MSFSDFAMCSNCSMCVAGTIINVKISIVSYFIVLQFCFNYNEIF